LAGLGLKSEELTKAFTRIYFNTFIQLYNFGFVSLITFSYAKFATAMNILNKDLADGMIICSCLPVTVNMVVVMTISCNGDEAAAIFNAAFGNVSTTFSLVCS